LGDTPAVIAGSESKSKQSYWCKHICEKMMSNGTRRVNRQSGNYSNNKYSRVKYTTCPVYQFNNNNNKNESYAIYCSIHQRSQLTIFPLMQSPSYLLQPLSLVTPLGSREQKPHICVNLIVEDQGLPFFVVLLQLKTPVALIITTPFKCGDQRVP
jgi:hypothetical protein